MMQPWRWSFHDEDVARGGCGQERAGRALRRLLGFAPDSDILIGPTSGLTIIPVWTHHSCRPALALDAFPQGDALLVVVGDMLGDATMLMLHGFTTADAFRRLGVGAKQGRKTVAPCSLAHDGLIAMSRLWQSEAPESDVLVCAEPVCRALFSREGAASRIWCPWCVRHGADRGELALQTRTSDRSDGAVHDEPPIRSRA